MIRSTLALLVCAALATAGCASSEEPSDGTTAAAEVASPTVRLDALFHPHPSTLSAEIEGHLSVGGLEVTRWEIYQSNKGISIVGRGANGNAKAILVHSFAEGDPGTIEASGAAFATDFRLDARGGKPELEMLANAFLADAKAERAAQSAGGIHTKGEGDRCTKEVRAMAVAGTNLVVGTPVTVVATMACAIFGTETAGLACVGVGLIYLTGSGVIGWNTTADYRDCMTAK